MSSLSSDDSGKDSEPKQALNVKKRPKRARRVAMSSLSSVPNKSGSEF